MDPSSADNASFYVVQGAVRKHKRTVYSKPVKIRNVKYNGQDQTVAINLVKPYTGAVQVTVHSGIRAADGASSGSGFSAVVTYNLGKLCVATHRHAWAEPPTIVFAGSDSRPARPVACAACPHANARWRLLANIKFGS
jgi:hypothetical protein